MTNLTYAQPEVFGKKSNQKSEERITTAEARFKEYDDAGSEKKEA